MIVLDLGHRIVHRRVFVCNQGFPSDFEQNFERCQITSRRGGFRFLVSGSPIGRSAVANARHASNSRGQCGFVPISRASNGRGQGGFEEIKHHMPISVWMARVGCQRTNPSSRRASPPLINEGFFGRFVVFKVPTFNNALLHLRLISSENSSLPLPVQCQKSNYFLV